MKHQIRTQPTEDKSVCKKLLTPIQRTFKYWVRPSCSGFHPGWASNLPGWGQPQPPGPQPHCCSILMRKCFFLISSISLLRLSLCHCLLLSTHTLLWSDQLSIHHVGARDAPRSPQAAPFPSWNRLDPTASLSKPRDPAHDYARHLPLNSLQLLVSFLQWRS